MEQREYAINDGYPGCIVRASASYTCRCPVSNAFTARMQATAC